MDDNLKLICRFVEDNKAFIAKNPADKIPDIFIEKYRSYVETLCEHNIELGLLEKAYGSYTGNAVFKQDWKISEELLLKLVELHQNPWAANSLGYIYYYGRTTNDVPHPKGMQLKNDNYRRHDTDGLAKQHQEWTEGGA